MTKKWQIVVPSDFESTDTRYRFNGTEYYRVTHLLGVIANHALTNWRGKIGHAKANQIMETRQAIGTHVHKLIELTLQGKKINLGNYETEIQEGLCKFYEFRDLAKLEPQGLEQRLWSNKYKYAGTADYIGKYTTPEKFLVSTIINHKRVKVPKFSDGALVIGDWKTSKNIYPKHWLQLAAYAWAFYELTGIKVDGAVVVNIRDGRLRVKEMTWDELMLEFEAFTSVIVTYEWQYSLGRWKKR